MSAPPRPGKIGAKPWLKGQVDDLASLANLDDAILLEELRTRYSDNKIYTYVGDILVAINPFQDLPIYTPQVEKLYHDTVKSAAPPHIYAIADQAYHSLVRNSKNQCAVISGESGAGKTESAKLLMKHIIRLCHMGSEGELLERKIIEVNPLLEAFGNAQTLMNHNSSRFGKYTELDFDSRGAVVGAQISEYLLEKSRVVRQNPGENNFHVFYYVFASPNAGAMGLDSHTKFPYVAGCRSLPPNNAKMYNELVTSLNTVGFSNDELMNIHQILATVLHLGNVCFDAVYSDTDPAEMSSPPAILERVAKYLGVDSAKLKEGLMAMTTLTRGEAIRRPYSCEKARDCRDAVAKALYGRLFSWIVTQINELLSPGMTARQKKELYEIGILDIFGFEHFDQNGFEQFCINVANEQLQSFFNQHIFQYELEEYKREGIDGSNITFVDNKPLLDLCFTRPIGIFSLLDEECRFPKATDETLIQKYATQFNGNGNYVPSKTSEACFTINHYAGNVTYHSQGFLDRNRDMLAPDILEVLSGSSISLVSKLFLEGDNEMGGGGRDGAMRRGSTNTVNRRPKTVGAQFVSSLAVLMEKMQTCMAHFVRCIKPNTTQSANNFVPDFVNRQLRYTGMLETTRIRREGYSFRPTFADFMERFGILAYGPSQRVQPSSETCRHVLNKSGVAGWLVGHTKVFLKYWQVEQLDKSIKLFHDHAKTFQKVSRGFLARMYRKNMRIKVREQARQTQIFFDDLQREMERYGGKQQFSAAEDMRRAASGIAPRRPPPSAPPPIQKSEKELKREASILWWKEKEAPKGAGQDAYGNFLPWFHGLISRQESEQLLAPRYIGCFLVRVSENRFGYTLSYRVSDRCRHYMVEQDTHGRYALVGVPKVCSSLNELIEWFSRNRVNEDGDMLREPCGQAVNQATGEEECDYGELLGPGQISYRSPPVASSGPPPPVSRANKPGSFSSSAGHGGAAPPPVSRASKPGSFSSGGGGGGAAPPPVSRASKPRF